MPHRPPTTLFLLVAIVLFVAAPHGVAQTPGDASAEARRAMGILIRNPDTAGGAPPYALSDQYGRVRRYVEPSTRVDLERHVGQRVRIKHDTGQTLLASQLELPLASGSRELRRVAPSRFQPPGRVTRLADADATPPGRYSVVPAQGTDAADDFLGAFGEGADDTTPIDLDEVIANEDQGAGELPAPSDRTRLDPIPLAPADDTYYPEIAPAERVHTGHDPNCPHCNQQRYQPTRSVEHHHDASCPHCQAKTAPAVTRCRTCGRSEGWCGPTCDPASRPGLYGRAEYLLWWFDGMNTPPLATTNTAGGAPILGTNGTAVVYGGELLDDARSGLRFTLGAWLDAQRDVAVEGDWLFFETETDVFYANDPTGAGVLGRPFYNVAPVVGGVVQPPTADAEVVAFPNAVGGALAITARSRFQSAGVRLRTGICCRDLGGCGPCACSSCSPVGGVLRRRAASANGISRIDFVAGYRFTELEEELVFAENATFLAGSPNAGGTITGGEVFETDNDFHGFDLGVVYDLQGRRWGLELTSKIALGSTSQQVRISGANTVGAVGVSGVTTPGLLYAQPSNIGSYQRDRFSVLPELSARLSYRVTQNLSLSAAYTVLYWANVVRPGDQIDFSVDGRLASGALTTADPLSHPRFDWDETSLWAHGFNFGLDYRY